MSKFEFPNVVVEYGKKVSVKEALEETNRLMSEMIAENLKKYHELKAKVN